MAINHRRGLYHARAEAYYKDYEDLVVEADAANFSNSGFGEAYGLDLFLKYSEFLKTRFNRWVSYSLLNSNRLQPRDIQ